MTSTVNELLIAAESAIRADRRRHTSSEKNQMERQAKRNEKFRSKPVEINEQPKKARSRYVGYVSFIWETGPKAGNKYNCQITLKDQARLKIRGRELLVMPRDGDEYVWGEKDPNPKVDPDKLAQFNKPGPSGGKREMRLRDAIQAKFDAFMDERGPHGAGQAMATCFVRAYKKLDKKIAKAALGKVYKSVLMQNKTAFLAFARKLRTSVTMSHQVDVDRRNDAMRKEDRLASTAAALRAAAKALEETY